MAKPSKKPSPTVTSCFHNHGAHQSLTDKIARSEAGRKKERQAQDRAKRPRPPPRDPLRRVDPPDVLGDPLHGMLFLAEAMGSGVSAAILRSEAQGQRDLVNSSQLPKKLQDPIEMFEKIGIVFVTRPEAASDRDLFVDVVLPTGWKLKATGHSMWSELLDDKGRVRASMFYKAAHYDRDAFIRLNGRFSWERYAPRPEHLTPAREDLHDRTVYRAVFDRVLDAIVFKAEEVLPILPSERKEDIYPLRRIAEAKLDADAESWLAARYPNWKDPTAHWGDP